VRDDSDGQGATSIEQLRAENGRLRDLVVPLRSDNESLQSENDSLRDRITRLESEIGRNSENSSKPPAQDPDGCAAKPRRTAQGGQGDRPQAGAPPSSDCGGSPFRYRRRCFTSMPETKNARTGVRALLVGMGGDQGVSAAGHSPVTYGHSRSSGSRWPGSIRSRNDQPRSVNPTSNMSNRIGEGCAATPGAVATDVERGVWCFQRPSVPES
jgi:hypothetical protein